MRETASGHKSCHSSSLCQLYFHGMRALLGEGNMLLPHPCFGRVCLQEGTGWGKWLERLTSARVLLAQKWVEPTSGTGEFCRCSRVSGRCRVHGAAICRFQVGGRQFCQPILPTLPRRASSRVLALHPSKGVRIRPPRSASRGSSGTAVVARKLARLLHSVVTHSSGVLLLAG